MLFYLVKDLPRIIRRWGRVGENPEILSWATLLEIPRITIDEDEISSVPTAVRQAYCRRLNAILTADNLGPMIMTAHFTMFRQADPNHPMRMTVRVEGPLLGYLQNFCEQTLLVSAELYFKNVENRPSPARGRGRRIPNYHNFQRMMGNRPLLPLVAHTFDMRFKTTEMQIQEGDIDFEAETFVEETELDIPFDSDRANSFVSYWEEVLWEGVERFAINMELSIYFPVDDDILTQDIDIFQNLRFTTEAILEQGFNSDITIVASNGSELAAHKCFLSANSPVFEVMLRSSNFQESWSNRIEMVGTSEQCIKALLEYLYTFQITQARNSPMVAVELFQIAHMYDIPALERLMATILQQRPQSWFDIDTAFELFHFARHLDIYAALKNKAQLIIDQDISSDIQLLKTGPPST